MNGVPPPPGTRPRPSTVREGMGWWRWTLRVGLFCLLVAMVHLVAQTGAGEPITDAEIKATLLFKFVPFVRWPKTTLGDEEPFVFCILGEDPFGEVIDHYQGRIVKGRALEIRRVASLAELEGCDMLFISASEIEKLDTIFTRLERRPILTVSDQAGLGERGVMINFFEADETIRFEINPKASRKAGLKIGSQLLRLAKVIDGT
ncbi:YfiR family protein [Sulfidibacter corallicola]|uniref:YfiR family protein n=1 Tax=Sulfidibacter corallicola TaxID=2818388 RepID=A0A8A4TMV5_SULCO|nr:YfiR family protein [Sulfidibacter corallicola]QTD50248.1 YfiR family protein [Sulfidibacter corallicola]